MKCVLLHIYLQKDKTKTKKWCRDQDNTSIVHNKNRHTDLATYGASIPPIRATQELEPIPAFLTTVGNSSAENT